MVVVGANHGITRMTKEHVGMAIALNVPLFVVITKATPPTPSRRHTHVPQPPPRSMHVYLGLNSLLQRGRPCPNACLARRRARGLYTV